MKVFVTGGNGFIGSVVVRDLVAAGHAPVCLLRSSSITDRIDALPFDRVAGDVRDVSTFRNAQRSCDATIHLAAPGGWGADDAATLDAIIVGGTRNVLDSVAGIPGHRVVVVSSTAAINASDTPRIFDETSTFDLRDTVLAYAHAKRRAESCVRDACARGVAAVVVNPAEVYGPNDVALATAGSLLDFATSTPVLVCSGGTSVVHVDDVSAGILATLERGRTGERYILGGDNVSIRRLAELTLDIVGRRSRIITVPNQLVRALSSIAVTLRIPLPFNPHVVPYATRYWFVDNAKARRELGVTFRSARATIEATIGWLVSEGLLRSGRRPARDTR